MITRFRLSAVGLAVAVLAIPAAACGDDDNGNSGDVSAQLALSELGAPAPPRP